MTQSFGNAPEDSLKDHILSMESRLAVVSLIDVTLSEGFFLNWARMPWKNSQTKYKQEDLWKYLIAAIRCSILEGFQNLRTSSSVEMDRHRFSTRAVRSDVVIVTCLSALKYAIFSGIPGLRDRRPTLLAQRRGLVFQLARRGVADDGVAERFPCRDLTPGTFASTLSSPTFVVLTRAGQLGGCFYKPDPFLPDGTPSVPGSGRTHR